MARGARRGGTGTKRGGPGARPSTKEAKSYAHPEATSLLRPDVGTQAQFRKKKPPQRYRYDSSPSPALDWDGQNPAREQGEALICQILQADSTEQAKAAAEQLKELSKLFLNWAGKAERLSFDVPTLPLFVHERLSTKAILETLKGHKRDRQLSLLDLFSDPQHPIHDQVLRALAVQAGKESVGRYDDLDRQRDSFLTERRRNDRDGEANPARLWPPSHEKSPEELPCRAR